MKKKGKILSFLAALALLTSMTLQPAVSSAASSVVQMEYLDRGTVAVDTGSGVYLSWRLLGTEDYDTEFDIYRDGGYVATVSDSTNYTDPKGTKTSTYQVIQKDGAVAAVVGMGTPVWENQYLTIPLDRPEGGTSLDGDEYTYSPNDVIPADMDGDGQYELILKWEPSNSFDSGKDARHNGNVYIDCYELSGEKLWRIDMGININAGAHFTQIAAYDFDLDGKAELAMKTAPGTKDGEGNYVSSASLIDEIKNTNNTADYRHSESGVNDTGGRVMSGPEFYTVFQGDTGAALDTVYYPHPRGTVKEWGDNWGNRSERYLAGVAYLDGKTPSMLAWRGYYAKTTVTAYDLVDKKLVQVVDFDTSKNGNGQFAGNGNHNLTVGDVDGDGCDEVLCGALALDNDLSVLWCSGRGHGDALHLADYDPTHDGLEYFSVHEDYKGSVITGSTTGNDGQQHLGGMTLYKAESGEELFHVDSNSDQGRGMMANVGYSDGYFELWGSGNYVSYGGTDVQKSSYDPDSANQRVFWDGDVYDELFDGTGSSDSGSWAKISDNTGRITTLKNVTTNNGTKNNAGLIADILGDWREEIVMRGQDDASLVVYTTTIPTEHKLYTLMHDRTYRMQVAAQNAGYNQPPHIGYYISENNDEYDARKTAAYVETVHDGVTEVRTDNTPEPVTLFTAEVSDGQIAITNRSGAKTDAVIYTARYVNGALERVTKKDITIPASGYKGEIDAQVGDSVFVWDTNQQPLTDKLTVKPEPTAAPTTEPTASPTPVPTASPSPTPTMKPEFVIENGVLTEYNGDGGNVVIPDSVTTIAHDVFYGNNQIESVEFPDSLTKIGDYAFADCQNLSRLDTKNVETISRGAFYNSGLREVILRESLNSIGRTAFAYADTETTWVYCREIGENLPTWCKKMYGYADSPARNFAEMYNIPFFDIETDEPLFIPEPSWEISEDGVITEYSGYDTNLVIPNEINGITVTAIGNSAFMDNSVIESVTLPDTVVKIEHSAFGGCTALKSFDSNKVETIGETAFYGCSNLEEITFRESLRYIEMRSFLECEKLRRINVYNPDLSLSGYNGLDTAKEIYGYEDSRAEIYAAENNIPFYNIETGELIVKDWVMDEENKIIKYNGSETEVTIPETVDSKPVKGLDSCLFMESDITSVVIPDCVEYAYSDLFLDCRSLKTVRLSAGMSKISEYTFGGCTALEDVYIPAGITQIDNTAFEGCDFKKLKIHGSIGSYAHQFASGKGIAFYDIETGNLIPPIAAPGQ